MVDFAHRALETAPTLLETRFWAWIVGHADFAWYAEELMITPLEGPGHLPDDFEGVDE